MTRTAHRTSLLGLAACFLLAGTTLVAPSASADETRCGKLGKDPFLYAIGSSTLGMSMAPILKKSFKKRGIKWRKWAKASSGLARPDFFNWAKKLPGIIKEWKPKVILIVLGTNDFQSLRQDKKWVHPGKKWDAIYGERVDELLKLAAGKNKHRMVIWVGPNMIDTNRARYMAKRITRIVRARIKAFGGRVHFVDAYGPTNRKGQPRRHLKVAKGKTVKTYTKDGVHLTISAARYVLALPVLRILDRCRKAESAKAQ